MGNFLTQATDTKNNFQAQNPYNVGASMATEQANQKAIFDQQQQLAEVLRQQQSGQGPSASQTMLNTAMQNNAANNNSMAVGQRGINPALAMRMAGENTTNANMQAEAQAVAARQQEQARATGELAGLYGTMGNQNVAQQGLITGAQQGVNAINSGTSAANTAQGQRQFSTLTNAAGGLLASGQSPASSPVTSSPMASMGGSGPSGAGGMAGSEGAIAEGATLAYDGGEIPPHMAAMRDIYHRDFKSGGKVPGTPQVPGNDPVNDTVNAKLSPGEVVIPNDIMQSKDPAGKAAKFVASIVEKKVKDHGDFKEALKRHVAGRKNK